MPPNKWDDEDEDSSTPPSSPPVVAQRRGKFDDEEEDSELAEDWDAEDSEEEREKAKKEAAAKAKAEAEKKANYKPAAVRRQEHIERRKQEALDDDSSDEDSEDEAEQKARLLREQKEADLRHAVDMFGDIGISNNRSAGKHITVAATTADKDATGETVDLSSLPLFSPKTKGQFDKLRDTLIPLISASSKAPHYSLFLQEFAKQLAKDLPSDQIKKVSSVLTTLSNEKMKEEKAADKGGKKSKAAKTKVALNATRDLSTKADLVSYDDDGLGDDDFM